MSKRLVVVLAACLALAGCSNEPPAPGERQQNLEQRDYVLRDGRTVTCIVRDEVNKGGLSCDWAGVQ